MSRRYTPNEKRQALECLEASMGDLALASQQTGIPTDTLRRWQRQQAAQAEDHEARSLQRLRHKLLDSAAQLVDSLQEALDSAPLNQRSAALSTVIDKYIKLEAFLPQADQREQVIRLEYRYPDGSIHSTPPWAREDSPDEAAVSSGRLRETFRQDGNGKDPDYRAGPAWRALLVARPDLPDDQPGLAGYEDQPDERPWYHD